MNSKILIIGQINSTHLKNIVNLYKTKDIIVDNISLNDNQYTENGNMFIFPFKNIISSNVLVFPIIFILRILKLIYWCLKNNNHYNSIVFLFFKYEYYLFMPFFRKMSKRQVIVFYGSDFYGNPFKSILKFILRKVDNIYIVTPHLFKYFNDYYKNEFSNKSKMMYLIPDFLFYLFRNQNKVTNNKALKINLMIGTTGHPLENHSQVLKLLSSNPNLSNHLRIIIHVGYTLNDAEKKYVNELIHNLSDINHIYEVELIDKFLSYDELADLRNKTDILVNNRVFDQFSGGMLESMYCGTFVIAGSWLPYQYHKELGLYFESYNTIEEIIPMLWDYINNYEIMKDKLRKNADIIENEFDEEVIKNNWLKILD